MRLRTMGRRGERGLTLIEVLVSFFILFVVTLAVLQLLSMAYLVNLGALTRTELTYKAQQVVEMIRLQRYRFGGLLETPSALELNCCPVGINSSMTIANGDSAYVSNNCDQFWGPARANLIDASARYSLNYTIDVSSSVTVRAIPLTTGANQYLGPAAGKVVVYVAQLH
ncbi:MAG: prepilin-type N-terminal cleavage/methylation domain-containing protein [Acidobacteriia bacterium]|nr:prepilin-type N-terminal cleavage/methylation domain-containing protein [Terriglobia bacterium]